MTTTKTPSTINMTCEPGALKVEAAKGDESKQATFSMVAYTGGAMNLDGWYEPVVVDLAGLKAGGRSLPVRLAHVSTVNGIGHTTELSITDQVTASGIVSRDTDAAREFVSSAKKGFPWQASIGASVEEYELVKENQKAEANGKSWKGPIYIIRKATLAEISIVDLGADNKTAVHIAAKTGETNMTEEMKNVRAQERVRIDEINALAEGITSEGIAELKVAAIAEDITLDEFKNELLVKVKAEAALNTLRAERPQNPAFHVRSAEPVGDRSILAAAFMLHSGKRAAAERQYGAEVCARAEALGVRHVADIAAHALRSEGKRVTHSTDTDIRAAFSTITMPVALSESIDKTALDAYQNAPSTWRAFCKPVPVNNFREATALRPSFNGALEVVAESGEIHHGTISELDISFQAKTYGKMLTLTRQAMINDDAGLLLDTGEGLGRNAVRAISDEVVTVLLGNAGSHFSGTNAQLLALGVEGLAGAITKLRTMRANDGRDLDLTPTTLLVPAELEETGAATLASTELARYVSEGVDKLPTGNAMKGKAALAVDGRLSNSRFTGYSATGWYLFASPTDAPMVICFLNGMDRPTVESQAAEFNTLGWSWRVFIDFGVSLGDPKAAIFSEPGA